ncbi:MAG: VWA domain-containing protein [Candidatus Peribacteria bacterium]|jgi:protein-disulfide isomerase|nr:VWA domain-containing protein [Candidatus Peribacteria bacterium]
MTDTHALERKEIQTGKRKKLIFVFSDGESNEASRLKAAIDRWRQQGVYVYGVGIGDEADVSHYLTNAPKQ